MASEDLILLISQLRDLLLAGLALGESLEVLTCGASVHWSIAKKLLGEVSKGSSFSQALALNKGISPLLIALVRTSEGTSDLSDSLGRYIQHEGRLTELRHRLIAAWIYPILVTTLGALVLLFLGFYVMPRFATIFEGVNGDLPFSARAMLAWSHWLSGHGPATFGAVASAICAFIAAITVPSWRSSLWSRLMATGLVTARLRTHFLARWYRSTGLLVQGGIPFPEALRLATEVLPESMQAGGRAVERHVRDGLSPSQAHERAGMATVVAAKLMQAGERTGDLGTVLTRIADFHDAEVTRQLERVMRALEPIVMTLVGLGVGIVVVAMYLPIFELASTLQ